MRILQHITPIFVLNHCRKKVETIVGSLLDLTCNSKKQICFPSHESIEHYYHNKRNPQKKFQSSHNKPEANYCFSFMYNHISKKDLQTESHKRPPDRMSDIMRKETHVHFYLLAANTKISLNKTNWERIEASLYCTLLLVRRYICFMKLSV